MKTTEDEARDILYEENDNFKIISDELIDQDRWTVSSVLVVKELTTGKFFKAYYSQGATEQQDQAPFEYAEIIDWKEVFPVEKTVTVYE